MKREETLYDTRTSSSLRVSSVLKKLGEVRGSFNAVFILSERE